MYVVLNMHFATKDAQNVRFDCPYVCTYIKPGLRLVCSPNSMYVHIKYKRGRAETSYNSLPVKLATCLPRAWHGPH